MVGMDFDSQHSARLASFIAEMDRKLVKKNSAVENRYSSTHTERRKGVESNSRLTRYTSYLITAENHHNAKFFMFA